MWITGPYLSEYALGAVMKKCETDDIIMGVNGSRMTEANRLINATPGMFHTVHASLPRDTEDSIFYF